MGKKKEERLQGEEQSISESDDSQMQRKMDQFNSDESWSDLDQLQCQLFNGTHEVSSPEDMPKKTKKRDRKKERQDQINQYQEALKISQQQNTFVNPYSQYQLNVNIEQYRKMLYGVVQGTTPPQGIARMLGIKSLRILHQQKLYSQFKLIKDFLEHLKVPEWVVEAHDYLLKNDGNNLFKAPQMQSGITGQNLEMQK